MIYPISAVFVYCALGQFLSHSLTALENEIDEFANSQAAFVKSCELAARVRKWKRQHWVVYETAYQLNHCFGCTLLVIVATILIVMVTASFLCLSFFVNFTILISCLIFMMIYVLILWWICCTSDNIRVKVCRPRTFPPREEYVRVSL